MTTIKNVQVPSGFPLVSFGVKSLFINVPLEYAIWLVLERIYNKGELENERKERNFVVMHEKCSFQLQ